MGEGSASGIHGEGDVRRKWHKVGNSGLLSLDYSVSINDLLVDIFPQLFTISLLAEMDKEGSDLKKV